MSDHDRLMSYATRQLDDGCDSCSFSLVYCHCVQYIDSEPCCESCSHTSRR